MNHPINSHTSGPFRHEGTELLDVGDVPSIPHAVIRSEGERWVALVEVTDGECEANARLIPAALNAFDKAGRELEIDAAELAERIDLSALIKAAGWAAAVLVDAATGFDSVNLRATAERLREESEKLRAVLEPVQNAAGRD